MTSDQARAVSVAIVMPAYNAAQHFEKSLPAAMAAAKGREVIVVDPGSTDDTAAIAERAGVRVLRLGRRAGPAEARNEGARLTNADVLLFIDADCVAHTDVVDRVQSAFSADPLMATLTGSYDDTPPDPGFFSQYMNLRHHHTHQLAKRDDATFWAGCGAVRRDAFLAVGGFDAKLFPKPMIEDIELGLRMKKHGATRLDPDLHVTHLKRWTMTNVVMTDIFCRAVPWTKLIVTAQGLPNDLNLRASQRVAAAVAPLALLAIPVLVFAAWRRMWIVAAVAVFWIALSLLLNAGLVRFFAKARGPFFAVGGWAFHQVHLFYSAVTFALVTVTTKGSGKK